MPALADNLRELHLLHQRAKTLKDRLSSGPKTLATRRAVLDTRRAAVEAAKKALQDAKSRIHSRETSVMALKQKTDDLRVKLNAVKKQVEYEAIRNQLANDNASIAKLEDETLEAMAKAEDQTKLLADAEADAAKLQVEVDNMARDISSRAAEGQAQVKTLMAAIIEAEGFIDADQREQYRRSVNQRGAEALGPVEDGACTGCFVTVTSQSMNELINGHALVFCKTCGRILYLAEHDTANTRRTGK